jgi:hypothetical protein
VARETGRYIVDGVAPRRFAVLSVTDDLDFYPARADQTGFLGTASMRWYIATPDTGGAFVEVQGHAVADYVVDPSAYAPGDALSLRVEIDDRVGRQIVCDPAQPTCSLEQNECLQRVTWGVEIR